MKDILWGAIGVVIAAAALVYLVGLLMLRKNGVQAEGEVISAEEKKKGTFVHTLRYTYKGKTIESDDRTGFSQPLRVGEKRTITVDSRDPKRFEYTDELKKNIIITSVMVCLAVVFSVKFILAGLL